ncbi:MAG: HIRAN domain-containing protein [Muribaculaceae bacterium]
MKQETQKTLCTFVIAGIEYSDAFEAWNCLMPGTKLKIVRESNNIHDPNAIFLTIDWSNPEIGISEEFKIGYVPRYCNSPVAALIDMGWLDYLECRLTKIEREPHNNGIHAEITISQNKG